MTRPNQFLSPEGDLEDYFVDEYWLIDQYVGDQLWTWGTSGQGQLGVNDTSNRSTPVTTFAGGTNWKQVSAGYRHTVAIKTDGTLWVWGGGGQGQLGVNDTSNRSTPVTTFAGGTNWKQVSSGGNYNYTAAIKTDGTLWVWGSAINGQLANGVTGFSSVLTPITTFAGGTNWRQVTCGYRTAAAIKTDGTLWTWGSGGDGILGINDLTNKSTPVTTFAGGTNWKQVSFGYQHVAAIKTDGTLWTWGITSASGSLGNGQTTGTVQTPITTFAGGTNWKQVTCGYRNTSAIKTDGTLWVWGNCGGGRLGTNDYTDRSTPITTFAGGTNWKQVFSSLYRVSFGSISHTAAIKTDGTLWTWGRGSYGGQLGTGDLNNKLTPVTTFAGGTNWKQVSSGASYTAAIQAGINAEYPLS